jgi:hypothetical protein
MIFELRKVAAAAAASEILTNRFEPSSFRHFFREKDEKERRN